MMDHMPKMLLLFYMQSYCALQHTVRLHVQCTNCNSANFTNYQPHIIPISIPASVKSMEFSELIGLDLVNRSIL